MYEKIEISTEEQKIPEDKERARENFRTEVYGI